MAPENKQIAHKKRRSGSSRHKHSYTQYAPKKDRYIMDLEELLHDQDLEALYHEIMASFDEDIDEILQECYVDLDALIKELDIY